MFFAKILIFVIPIVIGILIFDYIKDYKKNHWYIQCSHCGLTYTEYKSNDSEKVHYAAPGRQPVRYTEKGIPTFICHNCGKEFDLGEGTWVRHPIARTNTESFEEENDENKTE